MILFFNAILTLTLSISLNSGSSQPDYYSGGMSTSKLQLINEEMGCSCTDDTDISSLDVNFNSSTGHVEVGFTVNEAPTSGNPTWTIFICADGTTWDFDFGALSSCQSGLIYWESDVTFDPASPPNWEEVEVKVKKGTFLCDVSSIIY